LTRSSGITIACVGTERWACVEAPKTLNPLSLNYFHSTGATPSSERTSTKWPSPKNPPDPPPPLKKIAADRGGGGHDRLTRCVAAVLFCLAPFEITVRMCWRYARAAAGRLRSWPMAHAAAGVAPLETGFAEYFVEAFFFRLRLDAAGAGNNHACLMFSHVLSGDKMRGGAEITRRDLCTSR